MISTSRHPTPIAITQTKKWRQMPIAEKRTILINAARKNAGMRSWKGDGFWRQAMIDAGFTQPVVVIFYSGGFTAEEGQVLVQPLTNRLAAAGFRNILVLHHPDAYGMTDEGREPWKKYVTKLVEEIDSSYSGHKVLIFGHSRGAGLAMSLAVRLQERCLKLYVTGAGPVRTEEPTAWEELSKAFKVQPDPKRAVVEWLASLNPNALMLNRLAKLDDEQFKEATTQSPAIKKMVDMFMAQYVDAMYPESGSIFGYQGDQRADHEHGFNTRSCQQARRHAAVAPHVHEPTFFHADIHGVAYGLFTGSGRVCQQSDRRHESVSDGRLECTFVGCTFCVSRMETMVSDCTAFWTSSGASFAGFQTAYGLVLFWVFYCQF
eukprot:gnl/TRDRNA2_/TRDRNA2_60456_c0_seq1.p1 gnl/TRDRNA2_/TRDRNA2_60456_c0~~gnl/TRDRNA2_/TRDRNA2_60456_c0_seq1.p1  ORF type:complete len:376 (+),score=30.56 gnl/TRDRNA2_/TRDRNA2_60456_c0_seq1:72-1199(+)